jgi:hypothetical protein
MPKTEASLGRGLSQILDRADPAYGALHAEEAGQIDIELYVDLTVTLSSG